MKAKIILPISIVLISIILFVSFIIRGIEETHSGGFPESIDLHGMNNFSKQITGKILCDGVIFNMFPILNGLRNKEFEKILAKIPKNVVKESFWDETMPSLDQKTKQYMFSEFKKHIYKEDGFIDYNTRMDGTKLDWSLITIIPTNGKFIMVLLNCYEKDSYAPPTRDYYLATFNLEGNLISLIYVYGELEYKKNNHNIQNINQISSIQLIKILKPKLHDLKIGA